MTDPSTGITFAPKVKDLDIAGVGVRKKGPIKIYSIGMYTTELLKEKLSVLSRTVEKAQALESIRSGAGNERPVCFQLKTNMKVGGEKMASAIATAVTPRHKGDTSYVTNLKDLIFSGVASKGGSATKGTMFQFDCSSEGVGVCVDGKEQGFVPSAELSRAFCDIYLDENTVSPPLLQNCMDNWCLP